MDFDFCIFEMHASYKIYDHLWRHAHAWTPCFNPWLLCHHHFWPTCIVYTNPPLIQWSESYQKHGTSIGLKELAMLSTHIGQIIYSIGNDRSKWPDWHLSQTHYSGGFKFQNQVMNSNIRQSMTCCSRSAPSSCTPFRISVQHTRWGLQCFV